MELAANPLMQGLVTLTAGRLGRRVTTTMPDVGTAAFDRAIAHFEAGDWSLAFEDLVPLADAGDREAARIALLMAARGPRLFGRAFAASPAQREVWLHAGAA
jgi:hypothetical protein